MSTHIESLDGTKSAGKTAGGSKARLLGASASWGGGGGLACDDGRSCNGERTSRWRSAFMRSVYSAVSDERLPSYAPEPVRGLATNPCALL